MLRPETPDKLFILRTFSLTFLCLGHIVFVLPTGRFLRRVRIARDGRSAVCGTTGIGARIAAFRDDSQPVKHLIPAGVVHGTNGASRQIAVRQPDQGSVAVGDQIDLDDG